MSREAQRHQDLYPAAQLGVVARQGIRHLNRCWQPCSPVLQHIR
jgi:hypothetical protein